MTWYPEISSEAFVRVPVAGTTLDANIHKPKSASPTSPVPAVVLTHGFGGNRNELRYMFVWLAAELARQGIATLRIDCRGFGTTGGALSKTNIETYTEDVCAGFDFLASQPDVDASRIAFLGLSMGGLASALAAGARPTKALCLWEAPFNPLFGIMRAQNALIDATNLDRRNAGFNVFGTELGTQWVRAFETLDIPARLSSYEGASLIVHGTADLVVPLETVASWQVALKQKPQVVIIPGADHGFTFHAPVAISHSVDFLRQVLSA